MQYNTSVAPLKNSISENWMYNTYIHVVSISSEFLTKWQYFNFSSITVFSFTQTITEQFDGFPLCMEIFQNTKHKI